MKRIMICILLSALFAVGMVSAGSWCYQETANDSTVTSTNPILANGDCGLIFTGSYNIIGTWTNGNQVIDGNWDSAGTSSNGQIYMNYTKPPYSISSSLWQTKEGIVLNPIQNLSLSSCWNGFIDKLVFRVNVSTGIQNNWDCNDGTNWINLRTSTTGRAINFNEEAIWWRIEIPPTVFVRYDDKTATIPETYIERFDDGSIGITTPKNIFKRIFKWITG